MLSVLIHTLGCKLNQLESEAFADSFRQAGFTLYNPSSGTSPSVIIINTCTVTSKADQKARHVIRKALRDYPDSCVLATGCYAQLDQTQINELETAGDRQRLFVLKGMEKKSILNLPRYLVESADPCCAVKIWEQANSPCSGVNGKVQNNHDGVFQFNPEQFSSHTRGFLKIQDGCDKHCTYCRVRLARGPSISLDAEQALTRLRILEESCGEAVLTGVNICQYRESGAASLGKLLEYLLAGTEKISLRLSSLAPDSIDENFAKIISNKRIRSHFHLSIQSCSERILKKMGRNYNVQTIEKAAALLRRVKDDPFLACDIITGFPSETKAEFEETLELCKKINFAWIHVFPYSKRPGTPAWSFPGAVQEKEITGRMQILTNLARQGRVDYVRRWLGREVEVLVENGGGSNLCRGISENYLKVHIQYKGEKAPPPGTVLRCKLIEEPHTEARSFTENTKGNIGDYDVVAEVKSLG